MKRIDREMLGNFLYKLLNYVPRRYFTTIPNDRNDKVPFIRRREEVVKKLEGQSGKILLNSF